MVNIHKVSVLDSSAHWKPFCNQPDCRGLWPQQCPFPALSDQLSVTHRPTSSMSKKTSFSFRKEFLQPSITAFIFKSSSVVSEDFLKQTFLLIYLTNLHSDWNVTQKSSLCETTRKLVSKDMWNQDENQQNIKGKFAYCHPLPSFQHMMLI